MADDLKDVIANWRNHLKAVPQQGITAIDAATLHKFLDAAEAGMRARDAALEEAAQVAERYAADLNQFDHYSVTESVVKPIRALKGAA